MTVTDFTNGFQFPIHNNITSGPSGELHGKTPVCKNGLNVKQVVNLGLYVLLKNTGGSIIAGRLAQETCKKLNVQLYSTKKAHVHRPAHAEYAVNRKLWELAWKRTVGASAGFGNI